eukprot:NODE_18287_length_900_cov_6.341527.p1 GENE.NODE_18287_length_900_cov_6.341527~~NODE_18287_length_900_cov_6.341527.p1  ORF type:complete len:180 (+),score=15.82 NODE_18287_length_900_cov_6.341527:87-626(+)
MAEGFWQLIFQITQYLSHDLLGGPRLIKRATVICIHKALTLPVLIAMIYLNDTWHSTALVYAGLHGGYGITWCIKDRVFPDPSFEKYITVPAVVANLSVMTLFFWTGPYLMITRHAQQSPIAVCGGITLFMVGHMLMMGSDAQKYFMLRRARTSSPTASLRSCGTPTTSARSWSNPRLR